jgi:succinate dehydrogenase / fumarate reductase, cytochrome b subunit
MAHAPHRFLNLWQIWQSPMALVSIGHRLAGVVLFLALPLLLLLGEIALTSEQGYQRVATAAASHGWQLVATPWIWAASHHIFAGVRLLLGDLRPSTPLQRLSNSAWLVMVGGALTTLAWVVWITL